MSEERAKRKLTAILSADVKGYSRLMGEDELATIETLKKRRELISTLVEHFKGRVVDSPGDNLLAEFSSVVDAVECAVKVQEELKKENDELPENRRMEFRIGVNLGDVVEDGERIYGDGVNIAARIESLSDGGGVSISGTAFDQVQNKLPFGFEYLGEHHVKNIAVPVRVYKILLGPGSAGKLIFKHKRDEPGHKWRYTSVSLAILLVVIICIGIWWTRFKSSPPSFAVASPENMAFPLPEKPSIAILPFSNLSDDPDQEYFIDGMTENIINALSKIPELFVVSKNATFIYKGKPLNLKEVSEELGVRYILEGGIQRAGGQLRVTVQLADATTGQYQWSEKYDRNEQALFALQDDITHKIVVALQVKLTEGEQARVRHHSTRNLKAWGYVVRGYGLFQHYNPEDNAKARELFKEAIRIDPSYATAWTYLAWTHWIDARFGYSLSRDESFKKAKEIAEKSRQIDDSSPDVHSLLGGIYLFQNAHIQALAEGEKSIKLGPNNAESHAILGVIKYYMGKWEETIALSEKAIRLSPYYPSWFLLYMGNAYGFLEDYKKAIETLERLLDRRRKSGEDLIGPLLGLIWNNVSLGRTDKAMAYGAEILRIDPNFSLDYVRNENFFKDPLHLEKILSNLRAAGLTDSMPSPLRDKPAIAVLPFLNMSDDPKQEYFSDGITEDIITDLSKISGILVMSRNSTFSYKGRNMNIQKIGQELGVQYVLEGSVRKAGDRVRINAQLINTETGAHLWAERYDSLLKDIFTSFQNAWPFPLRGGQYHGLCGC